MVCVVEILTTDGINFSAKSAKESGADFAWSKLKKLTFVKKIIRNIFFKFFINVLCTKQSKNLIPKKINPWILIFFQVSDQLLLKYFLFVLEKWRKTDLL